MSDIYITTGSEPINLSITETPSVVTLSQAVISGALISTVTVSNVVSVNVVTMPSINITPSGVTTVAGSITIGSCVTHGVNVANSVTISSLPSISGTVTALNADITKIKDALTIQNGEGNIAGIQLYGSNGSDNLPIFSGLNNDSLAAASGSGGLAIGYDDNNEGEFRIVGTDNPLPISGDYVGTNNAASLTKAVAIGFNSDEGTFTCAGVFNPVPVNINANATIPNISVSGTVTIGNNVTIGSCVTHGVNVANSITVGSLPVQLSTTTIGGTARLNVTLSSATTIGATAPSYGNLHGGSDGTNLRAISVDTSGRTVVTGTTSILGTPSVIIGAGTAQIGSVTASISGTVPVSGTLTALSSTGTITSNYNSNNTITTAGLAQLVANANTSRKYFVIQNISDTAMYLGVGYTPTTSTGLLLSANGGGMVFDGSFIPTEAVRIICSTAGKSFVAWEGS